MDTEFLRFRAQVEIAIRGAFINNGQNCISAERFYVQAGE
jgi:acyl-CoA reductase-like NAD-dependent aldehyde dehydrogenase